MDAIGSAATRSWFRVFELVSAGEEWELKDPAGVSLMHASSKKDLLWNAVRFVRAHVPSQLLVRGRDGQLLDEFTYAPVPTPPPL